MALREGSAPSPIRSSPSKAHDQAAHDLGVAGLRCRECGNEYDVSPQHACEFCFGPLEVTYDYERVARTVSRDAIGTRPPSLWRYRELLPFPVDHHVDLGTGWTTLKPAPRLAAELGLRKLWIKNDGQNPTHSFKDRVVSVALSVARYFRLGVAACASTGNLANAVAAHAAAAGMRSVVLIPKGLEAGKVAATGVFEGLVVEVDGSYDDVNRLCVELASSRPWAFVNVNMRPFYAEGSKTLGFEVVEQLGWRYPDAIVTPVASGALLTKVGKALKELNHVGLSPGLPQTRLYGAQAEGCAPVARAFQEGAEDVRPVKPRTVAKSLAIGNPADGYYALREVRASGGAVAGVPEDSVVEAIRLLARTEGIFTETAGGVTVAALERLVRAGAIGPTDETVVLVTGTGLKTLEALAPRATRQVEATLTSVEQALGEEETT